MISILITSFKEPRTVGKAISSMLDQNLRNFEIIVCAPDKETLDVAKSYSKKDKRVKVFKDPGKGKPTALNFIIPKCKGEIVVLTDGDVYVKTKILDKMLTIFKDSKVGAVTARVVSSNDRKRMMGFWSHYLCESFHKIRLYESSKDKDILCSGYFYAIRKKLFRKMPSDTLADDAFNSLVIQKEGYKTKYYPKAEVYVKYPTTLADWIRQKKRTAGRVYQLKESFDFETRFALKEELRAAFLGLKTIESLKEAIWVFPLFGIKLYLWLRTLLDFRLRKRSLKSTWQRVESTK